MIGYLTVFHVVVCFLIIALVLLQFGKGAEVGLFASSSENMFSTSQRKNVLARTTTVLVVLFIVNSILLARLQNRDSVLGRARTVQPVTTTTAPLPQTATNTTDAAVPVTENAATSPVTTTPSTSPTTPTSSDTNPLPVATPATP